MRTRRPVRRYTSPVITHQHKSVAERVGHGGKCEDAAWSTAGLGAGVEIVPHHDARRIDRRVCSDRRRCDQWPTSHSGPAIAYRRPVTLEVIDASSDAARFAAECACCAGAPRGATASNLPPTIWRNGPSRTVSSSRWISDGHRGRSNVPTENRRSIAITRRTATAHVEATTIPDDGIASHASDSFAAPVLPSPGARAPAQTQKTE